VGYDHHYMSFVYSCVLLSMVFLVLCIFVVGGVNYVCICSFLVDRVRLCFGLVC